MEPTSISRKRARPVARPTPQQLREDVLALIQSTKSPLLAQKRRIAAAYEAAWRAFCVAYASGQREDLSAHRKLSAALHGLQRSMQGVVFSEQLLVDKIAQSVVASRGNSRQQRLLLLWTWLGHASSDAALWRLEDVLVAVAARTAVNESVSFLVCEWLRLAICSLMETPILPNLLPFPLREASLSRQLISYLVQVAFLLEFSPETYTAALAHDVLVAVASDALATPAALALVAEVVAASIKRHESQAAVVASLRNFLRAQVKQLLVVVACSSSAAAAQPLDMTNDANEPVIREIISTLQSSVSPADAVLIFRQCWVEANPPPAGDADPIDALGPLLSQCAQRDRLFRLQALATAHDLAHNAINASDATLLRHSLELAAAATVGPTNEDGDAQDAGYIDWFKAHFSAVDALVGSAGSTTTSPETSRLSVSSSPADRGSSRICLRAPAPTPSSGGSTSSLPGNAMCGLVSTKRHLQFVCAFLSEFDRSNSPRRRAHHVLAHLSAIKTHHTLSGVVVGGLLTDFAMQARALYGQLRAKEHDVSARRRRRRLSSMTSLSPVKTTSGSIATPSQLTPTSSQYSLDSRSRVEELLELFMTDIGALVAKVNEWKMFTSEQWKREILPCCLDLEFWQRSSAAHRQNCADVAMMRNKRTSEMVALLQVLAKHHAVPTPDYVAFLDRAEAWFRSNQARPIAGRPKNHLSNEQLFASLEEAVDAYFGCIQTKDILTPSDANATSWQRVTSAFVAAFEGLVDLDESEQRRRIESVCAAVVGRLAREVATGAITLDRVTEKHFTLWIALLSSETHDGATPQERIHVVEAYCVHAAQQVTSKSAVIAREALVATTLLGNVLGLLASLTVCEAIARSCSLHFCGQLAPSPTDPTAAHLASQLKQASAFLSGFLSGFTKNPTGAAAPQTLLESMLTPAMRDCLVWTVHHSRTWWGRTHDRATSPPTDPVWSSIGQAIQNAYNGHGWLRLSFSPGVLSTKEQWQVFLAMEFTCCAMELLSDPPRVDLVEFINRQREQIEAVVLSSSGAQAARVRVADACIWIVQAVLELSASSDCSRTALNALVLLLKDVCVVGAPSNSSLPQSASDVLGLLMEISLQLCEKAPASEHHIIVQYACRCAQVVMDGIATSTISVFNIAPLVIRQFVNLVGSTSIESTVPHFEWIGVLWCLVFKLPHPSDVYSSATDLPRVVFARWAHEFPRLCRLLPPKKNGKGGAHVANMSLLRAVQLCFEFYRTLDIPGLGPAPSLSLLGPSASQYVPTSAEDETLEQHVRSIQWLIATDLLRTPNLDADNLGFSFPDFQTSLAFHETANRVFAALLEDVSIGRPEDVATELTEICQMCWLTSLSPASPTTGMAARCAFTYQLVLVHMVAELASRHASVGRFLLRSSSELLHDSRRSVFLSLVLVASSEIEQIDQVLNLNGSLWVNTFAEVACSLVDHTGKRPEESAASVTTLLQYNAAFQQQVCGVLGRLLSFAASKQIDLLDTTVVSQIDKLFPSLRELLARVPVLNLASAALSDW